jgi:hypothetical protein
MFRLKIGFIFAGLLAAAALSAAPASAFFEAEKGTQLSGEVVKANIAKGGEFVYQAGTAQIVKCPTTSPTIKWSLQTKSNEQQKVFVEWGNECILEIAGTKLAAVVSNSELEVLSPEKGHKEYTQLKGSNLLTTTVKAAGCEITVSNGSENHNLGFTEQINGTGFEETVKVNTTGVTATHKGAMCLGGTPSHTGELKGVEFQLKGQKQT